MEKGIETTDKRSLRKKLAKLALPIFIETLLIMMLGAVDTVMLSQHSDESVAAVGVVNQIVMLCFLIFEVINLGTSVLCSQYIGAGMKKRMVTVVGISLIVNLVVGLAVSAFLFLDARTILGWMGLNEQLMPDGLAYMRIVGAFAFFSGHFAHRFRYATSRQQGSLPDGSYTRCQHHEHHRQLLADFR